MNEIMNTAEVVNRLRKAMVASVADSVKTRLGVHEDVRGLNTAIALFLVPDGESARFQRHQIWMGLDRFARQLWQALDEGAEAEGTEVGGPGWDADEVLERLMQGDELHDLVF